MDKRQFEIVFRQQYSSLYHVALRYLQDGELAKDMVSEAFMAAWCRRDDIDGTKLENYLRACVRNKCLSQLAQPQPSTTAIDKQLVALMADDNDSEWLLRVLPTGLPRLCDVVGRPLTLLIRVYNLMCKQLNTLIQKFM